MKKFSSSASLSNNNNCNSNYYCSNGKSKTSAKITNKLIANQITNDIIKPKAISAAEAKLKNTNKSYSKIASSQSTTGSELGNGGGSVAYKIYNRQEIDANDYSIRLQQPCTSSIDVLSCISTNSSSDSSSTLNVCDYEAATSVAAAAATATAASSSSSSALNSRKKSIVNDYATADYVMHRPKSSQSQHNPYCKSPAEKPKQHRSKHYSAHGPRSQHSTGSGPIYAKKHQHSKKSTHHHNHNHNHTHKQTTAQYNTTASHSLHMPSTPPSLPPSPPPPLRLSTAKIDRHS